MGNEENKRKQIEFNVKMIKFIFGELRWMYWFLEKY